MARPAASSSYYRYAQQHIRCDSPLCRCPARDGNWYSFAYVCDRRRLIYFDVPKCASTTLRHAFFDDDHARSLVDPGSDVAYLRFSFVRNPWDRMVSNWAMFTTVPNRRRQLRSMTTENVSDFESFVYFARDAKNHHWQPQSLYLPEPLDFLGRLETFGPDLERLCSLIGCPPPEVRQRRRRADDRPYWTHYSPELVSVVGEMYREDVEAFGYEFGSER